MSLGLRGQGLVGTNVSGVHFDLLAVESDDFHYMSWYRDDFSDVPLSGIMRSLQPISRQEPLVLPPEAETFGMWVKPGGEYSNMFLWAAMQDSTGIVKTLSLGEVGPPEWTLMTGEMPSGLVPPVVLAAIQTYEPVFGPSGTAGSLLMDDMYVTLGNGEEVVLVDGFRGTARRGFLLRPRRSRPTASPQRPRTFAAARPRAFSSSARTPTAESGGSTRAPAAGRSPSWPAPDSST